MNKEQMIRFSKINTSLHKVSLDSIETHTTNNPLKVITRDQIRTDFIDKDGFSIIHTRTVSFDPNTFFKIIVAYKLQCLFDEDSKAFFDNDHEKIQAFIEKRKYQIFIQNGILNRMTNIVANLSKEFRTNPLIVPPYFEHQTSK